MKSSKAENARGSITLRQKLCGKLFSYSLQDHSVSDPPTVFMFASTFRWFQKYQVQFTNAFIYIDSFDNYLLAKEKKSKSNDTLFVVFRLEGAETFLYFKENVGGTTSCFSFSRCILYLSLFHSILNKHIMLCFCKLSRRR